MNVVICDDEQFVLERELSIIKNIPYIDNVVPFTNGNSLLKHLENNKVDIAFLDVEMFGIDGISLAKKIKDISPQTSIIFVTAYQTYAIDAFKIHARGYLLKPIRLEDVIKEIENIKEVYIPKKEGIEIQTFGNFEIFYKGKIFKFKRNKSKELIAYLVNKRGSSATTSEIICTLWEDKDVCQTTRSMFHNLLVDIKVSCHKAGIPLFIKHERNAYYVDLNNIDCDYINFLNGDVAAINKYTGEYMTNYSWAQFTTGYLEYKKYN